MARPTETTNATPAELEALNKEVQANAGKVPAAALAIFVQCQDALAWGGGWSLVSVEDNDYAMLSKSLKDFAPYRDNVNFHKVKGGVILEANPQWLLKILSTLAPKTSANRCAEYNRKIAEAAAETDKAFTSYWRRVQEGKTDLFNATDTNGNKRLTGTIGVFCTNSENTLTVNGVRYKAFRLSPQAILGKILQSPNADRVKVAVHLSENGKSTDVWMPIREVLSKNMADKTLAFPTDATGHYINRPNALVMRLAVV